MELALIRICLSGTDLLVGIIGAALIATIITYDWKRGWRDGQ